ncbi:hypothetical protein FXW78_29755 [Rhodococcus opacus]|nr:hypothetical protein [Rhodococcus opacus]
MILFHILGDLFRDRVMSGIVKILWIIFLIVLPYLAAFVYLIVRGGRGMAECQAEAQHAEPQATDKYFREVAAKSPGDQIADAKALLDEGTISQPEFDVLKAKALG